MSEVREWIVTQPTDNPEHLVWVDSKDFRQVIDKLREQLAAVTKERDEARSLANDNAELHEECCDHYNECVKELDAERAARKKAEKVLRDIQNAQSELIKRDSAFLNHSDRVFREEEE